MCLLFRGDQQSHVDRVFKKISVRYARAFGKSGGVTWTKFSKKSWSGVLALSGRAAESRVPSFQKNLGVVCLRLRGEQQSLVDRVSEKIADRCSRAFGKSGRVACT